MLQFLIPALAGIIGAGINAAGQDEPPAPPPPPRAKKEFAPLARQQRPPRQIVDPGMGPQQDPGMVRMDAIRQWGKM